MNYEYSVGPLKLIISTPDGHPIEEPDPAYAEFIRKTGRAKRTYNVRIEYFDNPSRFIPKKADKSPGFSFDADNTWYFTKFRGCSWYWSNDPNTDKCLWVLKINPNNINLFTREQRINPFRYPIDQLAIMDISARNNGFILHSAGGKMFGKGLAFTGVSGAGKTTISRLFQNNRQTNLLSDDRLLITRKESAWRIHGTPWPGEAGIARNEGTGLDSILILKHGRTNRIQPLTAGRAFETLASTVSIPWHDENKAKAVMDTIQQMLKEVPAYEFTFLPDKSAAEAIRKFKIKGIEP